MKFYLAVFIFAASLAMAGLAHSAPLDITNAKVAAGLLQVTGTSPQPNQNVQLDNQFTVMSDANNNFAFSLNSYLPSDCIVTLKAGAQTVTGVVANCGPRGLSPQGTWMAADNYLVDDVVVLNGSAWRALVDNTNKSPVTNPASWELFVSKGDAGAKGAKGDNGGTGPQGPAGDQGPQGIQGPQGPQGATGPKGSSGIAGATNGSVTLSGIANGRCTQVTFNMGAAQVGDTAIVSTRAAIQNGIMMYANRVASAGHIEVNACNFSGTSMTAISGFPVRIIVLR
jgi:hypothetical protein